MMLAVHEASGKAATMAWNLKGQMIESCSCNMFCPCWFGVQELMIMDQGWCASVIGFRIREGRSDGVALDGRKVVFTPDFPGPTLFDGNATARVFVDEGADEAQQRELEAIFQGRKGGPMENLAPLVATWLPTKKASIGIEEERETITVSVAGAGEMRSQLLRDPQGNAFTLRGGGFVSGLGLEEANLAPTSAGWADPEMPKRFETKSGVRGDFTWSG
jgi:hypothetical protein